MNEQSSWIRKGIYAPQRRVIAGTPPEATAAHFV